MINKTWVLLESGSISEPIECPFDVDLSELTLRDTFDGMHMSFRHTLAYRVVRPWCAAPGRAGPRRRCAVRRP